MADTVHLSLEEAHALAFGALTASGFSDDQAHAVADTVIAAERDGCTPHGLFRIPFYVRALQNPHVNARAVPELTERAPGVLHVDAQFGFAPLALQMSAEPLADKARANGIAALAINNAYHIAALWPEVERLAEKGLVAFAFTTAMAYVAPAGGTKPLELVNPGFRLFRFHTVINVASSLPQARRSAICAITNFGVNCFTGTADLRVRIGPTDGGDAGRINPRSPSAPLGTFGGAKSLLGRRHPGNPPLVKLLAERIEPWTAKLMSPNTAPMHGRWRSPKRVIRN